MATTKQAYEYSPSVNIKRDLGKNLRYIPTYNGQRAFEQIVESAALGTRTFTIIGAYGSGKSTFLWALAETAAGRKTFFDRFDYLLKGYPKNQLLDFVGEFTSLQVALANELKCKPDEVISALAAYAEKQQKKQTALIIRIDEYGKFLEYAAKHDAQNETYFLQQLAELVNDAQRNILLITTLHQDFGAYASSLSERERKEWTKVKGRFKEITFNEPAEQLLRIAADRLANVDYKISTTTLKKLLQTVEQAKAFPLKDYFTPAVAEQLAPIELLAGSALVVSLQRYGQNERSFFSFIEAQDYYGLHQYLKAPDAPLYYLPHVYDYLIYHYYSQLTAQHNPDHRAWRLMRDKLEAAESHYEGPIQTAAYAVVKTIGLLGLLGNSGATIDNEFLVKYLKLAGGIDEHSTEEAIRLLDQHKHIRYRSHSHRYVLFEGTDVDIDMAIDEAGRLVEQVGNISHYLNSYFTFPVIPAKRYHIEVGTPRFFEVRLSDDPITAVPHGEQDGFINLVFSPTLTEQDLIRFSAQAERPILYVQFKQIQQIKEQVLNIEKVRIAKADHQGDIVAAREFEHILSHYKNLLQYFVQDKFNMASPDDVTFVSNGQLVTEIFNRRTLNNFLSTLSARAYPSTPHYLNEMVNKTKLSAAISTARKNLVKNLIEFGDQEDIGYPSHLFPPDKMIYLSLLKDKGFHRQVHGHWGLGDPTDSSFHTLWRCYEAFLASARQSKRTLQDFVEQLLQEPFKLKRGLIDVLLPVLLLTKKDALSLYHQQNDRFIPDLSADTLDLVVRKPGDYSVKTFSVEGIRLSVFNRYRELLSQAEAEKLTSKGFVDTIVPFLSFYRELPEYAKRTKKITKEAQRLREAILKATDPEKSFFEDFPQALGYSLTELHEDGDKLQAYFELMRSAIKEIQFSYDALLDRYEQFILREIIGADAVDFDAWRIQLQQRFTSVKPYVIAPYLKTFLQRINAPLDDKRSWLAAVAQVVLSKSIEQIQDDEEEILYTRFADWVHELDNYTDITQATEGTDIEEALRVEVTNLQGGKQMKVVKVPKGKGKQISAVEKKVGGALTGDKNLNIFILSKMLNELLK